MDIRKKINDLKADLQEYREIKEERRSAKNKNDHQVLLTQYADVYQKRVSEKTVLYESFWGRGLVDNPYAIFLGLLGRKEFRDLKHIWVIDDLEENQPIMDMYQDRKNVVFVKYQSKEYVEALATAKYLINNTTFQSFFSKKPEQIYVNTWHGTPIKTMGYQIPDGSFGVANIVRNFLSADHLLSANPHMTQMYLHSYKMEGIYPGEIIQEGYPRNDLLVKASSASVRDRLAAYGIKIQDHRKIILYAPTWRESGSGKAIINPTELLEVKERLEDAVDPGEYQILIKPHQLVYRQLKDLEEYRGLLVPSVIDANELMHITDILISDYSSIFLDYMVLDRPILFYIPDLEEYRKNRGLDLMPEELPGPASADLGEIISEIRDIGSIWERYGERYQSIKKRMCPYEDGAVSDRVVDAVFGVTGDYRRIRTEKTKERLLLHGGKIMENGISHSFLNLLEQVDHERFDVTVYIAEDPGNPAMRQNINDIPEQVRVLVRTGACVSTVDEDARREFVTRRGMYDSMMRRIYPIQMAKREFRRCFGDARFDYIVNFEGYNSMYSIVLLQGQAKIKSIWMHSDIGADMERTVKGKKTLRKALNFNVSLYPQYDRLVSCGRSVMEVNRKRLGTDRTFQNFVYAKNTVNEKRIRANLEDHENVSLKGMQYGIQNVEEDHANKMSAQLIPLPDTRTINFVTMGRLSTEKNHMALLRAFARLHGEYPETRLYILGDGPLREQEERKIFSLGLEDKVFLPGKVKNPFSVMRRCHCFILPSIHEGQPMVLLEARAIHMPIIVSDFSTVVDSILPEGQLLIQPTEEAILEGMGAFMRGKVPADYAFDVQAYNREAYQEFLQAVT